jgi:hypothetical protein
VLFAIPGVESFADDGIITNDDGADHGIRRRLSPAAPGKVERPTHVRAIVVAVVRRAFVRHSVFVQ